MLAPPLKLTAPELPPPLLPLKGVAVLPLPDSTLLAEFRVNPVVFEMEVLFNVNDETLLS